jgi:hypothetical protein
MSNEFNDIKDTGVIVQLNTHSNKEAVDIVNARIKSAVNTLKELGFSPTTEDKGVEAVFELSRMYENQARYGK